jgi:hypothetical protein
VTNKPDIERVLDRWFEEGPSVVPDHVLESALETIDHTKQRRVWDVSWRYSAMSNFAKIAVAGVLVLALGTVAFVLADRSNHPSVGAESESPRASDGRQASPSSQPTSSPPRPAGWRHTGSLTIKREEFTATLLADGRVLVVGGNEHIGLLASAELYDPSSGRWSSTGSLMTAREYQTATRLADGRVLVAGGYSQPHALASAELYDPSTGTWSATGSMATARAFSTATLLSDGRVLVVGGENLGGPLGSLATAELYDPLTGRWTATGSLSTAREDQTATRLADGKVLIAGGYQQRGGDPVNVLSSAELFDPDLGTWTSAGSVAATRSGHSATLLDDGKVLVAGGSRSASGEPSLTSSDLYDPATGTWSATGTMTQGRVDHTAILLSDGRVLVAGGCCIGEGDVLASAEVYDPATGTWSATESMIDGRRGQAAILLDTGEVLVVGGRRTGPTDALASSELYAPGL